MLLRATIDGHCLMRNAYAALQGLYESNAAAFQELKQAEYFPFKEGSEAPQTYEYRKIANTTKCSVKEVDMIVLARDIFLSSGKPACILNCANSYNVGGGFHRTTGSQEEYLFRNTTLVASLWPRRRLDDSRCPELEEIVPRDNVFYPLTIYGGVYSPQVLVTCINDRPLAKDEYFPCTVVSAAAMDLRIQSKFYGGTCVFDYDITLHKLRTILHMAALHGQTHLILTAIGCGAFQNPPVEVAKAFKQLLSTEFEGVFEEVTFAIISSSGDTLRAFKATFPG